MFRVGTCACGAPIYKRGRRGRNPKRCVNCTKEYNVQRQKKAYIRKCREKDLIETDKHEPLKVPAKPKYSHRQRAKDHPDYYKGWLIKVIANLDLLYSHRPHG